MHCAKAWLGSQAPSRPIGGECISAVTGARYFGVPAKRQFASQARQLDAKSRLCPHSPSSLPIPGLRAALVLARISSQRVKAAVEEENRTERRNTRADVRDARSCVTSAGLRTFRLPRATVRARCVSSRRLDRRRFSCSRALIPSGLSRELLGRTPRWDADRRVAESPRGRTASEGSTRTRGRSSGIARGQRFVLCEIVRRENLEKSALPLRLCGI